MRHSPLRQLGRSWAFSACAAAAAAFACRPELPAPEQERAPVVVGPESVIVVEEGRIELGPALSGSLEARERSVLVAEAAGTVVKVGVELGDAVKKGQLLARIEAKALQNTTESAAAALAAREHDHALAQRQLERVRTLVSSGTLPEQELERAEADLTTARAQLAEARAALSGARRDLSGASVESPMDGVISQKSVHQGDVVQRGAPLFVIIDPSSMRLSASVPSDALGVLSLGAPVAFRVRGLGDQRFTGKIERIGPAADPVTRQIPLLVSIPNPGGRLLAGLFAEGRVASSHKTALVLPTQALSQADAGPMVRRIDGDQVQVVAVKLGVEDPETERVEIVSGLKSGDRVLVGAARDLAAGTLVRIEQPPS